MLTRRFKHSKHCKNRLADKLMALHQLPKITTKSKKRVGRGRGSGKGKTAGRGMKGQKARSKIKRGFEGGQLKLIKRLPFVRGRGFKGPQRRPAIVNLSQLKDLAAGTHITAEFLREHRLIVGDDKYGIKILAKGELKQPLVFSSKLIFSAQAKEKILKAKGKISNSYAKNTL